ncbi:MAG: alanine--tRNA ligase, partial [Bacteroidetes bacterium]|nr:alanine--tRNA ligase [Bacteroidota bacterium]
MDSKKIRKKFLAFFEEKGHKVVQSAPMVVKNDPTLMFTNAGMNQFKDFFLGDQIPDARRVTDTQKCLRVSGKHNDLEEVGLDSYHHTMFEMLGNWSFGDYFKQESIDWAWALLVDVFEIDADRLYATVFEGDPSDGLSLDKEAQEIWSRHLPAERILPFGKKDNFWEMGETGPCGPCSEIHIDLRSDEERNRKDGAALVNQDHPLVIELWNLVFIQYMRLEDQRLRTLPEKHVDTGMGLERLCMVLQGKKSNYDSDLFMPMIRQLEVLTAKTYHGQYGSDKRVDIAFRVVVDHLRAVAFGIADGALPSNTGAGYVIRRILRRAVRYYYTFLDWKEPLLHALLSVLIDQMGEQFTGLSQQKELIQKIIETEERSFLDTLAAGLRKLESMHLKKGSVISGDVAFELYDTYGFPVDLTRLIAAEEGSSVDMQAFSKALQAQRKRSKKDATKKVGDWQQVGPKGAEVNYVGYDQSEVKDTSILKYRSIHQKGKEVYQLVLETTPFYAEGGGQVGDTGYLIMGDQKIHILDTQRENDLIINYVDQLPADPSQPVHALVNESRRRDIERNHSATHLLHAALREVLGTHVHQKGSLVSDSHLRFDFSHFEKISDADLKRIENRVNEKIRANIERGEERKMPIEQAKEMGAMMLFGEKYGEEVRVISFDPDYSIELCGGCHVPRTGYIGHFTITQETSVAAGIRRVEAVTAQAAQDYLQAKEDVIQSLREL